MRDPERIVQIVGWGMDRIGREHLDTPLVPRVTICG